MHIKHIHCMVEKLSECASCELEKGIECVDTNEMGAVIDMIKDLCEAEYYAHISKAMEEEAEEEEEGERRYYPRRRDSMGRFVGGGRRGFEPYPFPMRPWMDEETEWQRRNDVQEGRMYYPNQGSGTYSGGIKRESAMPPRQMSRYGYSHDEYMKSKQWDSADPEHHKMRKQKLDEYLNDLQEMGKEVVQDMTPEEKQLWKQKISKLMNL